MFTQLMELFSHVLFLFLHVTGGGTFPKALSAAEEKRCLEEMAQGSEAARQKLVEHNLRLVAHIIKKAESEGNPRFAGNKPPKGPQISSESPVPAPVWCCFF